MTGARRVSVACIGLHRPETQACVVTGYSHLRWQDSHDDGQFNSLYFIINGSYFALGGGQRGDRVKGSYLMEKYMLIHDQINFCFTLCQCQRVR